ncbi:CBS domain-containing protein [Nitrospira moscoviensis]|uniref:CBS domain-containing protein n=1 Tax=Nitrospira moscoviensis TaxID=42253 RepID=A0A0K2GJZ4_NITMO|nr:CBS domain-containing protein [Nitrospira moscoviensis]ALA60922.1 hypothetical protein NITMOv2_4548 [Nitrospira moscoviensis]
MHTPVFGQSPGFPSSVHTAPPTISVYDAARLMTWRHVGVIVVVRDHQPVGIVTDRDLATRVLGEGLESRTNPVSRVMTTPIVTMSVDESDEPLLQRMLASRIRQIPLVDGAGNLVGLAAVNESGEGAAIRRSTVLVPMVKRRCWRRIAFKLKQEVAANWRWIGATVAVAALGGVLSLLAVGHWSPWASSRLVSSSQAAPGHAPEDDRPDERPTAKVSGLKPSEPPKK